MKKIVIAAVVSLTLVPMGALAQERGGDAALGALSGAVVFGPVGAVAGAFGWYSAGPSLAPSLGWGGSGRRGRPIRVKNHAAGPRAPNPSSAPKGPAPAAKPLPPPVP